eukprot:3011594-Rhodomonas_salina.2
MHFGPFQSSDRGVWEPIRFVGAALVNSTPPRAPAAPFCDAQPEPSKEKPAPHQRCVRQASFQAPASLDNASVVVHATMLVPSSSSAHPAHA